ncbi:MAG: hypothetical protein ACYDB7_04210 [Mycobacteriales bacterium]
MTEISPEPDAHEQAQSVTDEPLDPATVLDRLPDEVDEGDAWEQAIEIPDPDEDRR